MMNIGQICAPIMYSLFELSQMMKAGLTGRSELKQDWQLFIDSRTVIHPRTAVFLAIRSRQNDGHRYIAELIRNGVSTFVVNADYSPGPEENINYLKVEDTLKALQDLVRNHRSHFSLPVIGITGSNGKTIVKEWLNLLLGKVHHICASPKSYNSQIGVPLSVWGLKEDHTLGIFEAGISKPGEMQILQKIMQPDIGILTHLGTAHDEGFTDFKSKLREKLILFSECRIVLLRHDESVLELLDKECLTFGFNNEEADLNIVNTKINKNFTELTGQFKGLEVKISIPFTDEASIENACLCWLTVLYLDKFDPSEFLKLTSVQMRLELKHAINNCLLINDSYSNDLNALSAAFSFLKRQSVHKKTTVILSDIEQSGLSHDELCIQVKRMLLDNKVDRFYAIGQVFFAFHSIFKDLPDVSFFATTLDFLKQFNPGGFSDETILLKGARSFQFEAIAARLEKQTHGTMLEINLTAVLNNLGYIKSRLPEHTKIMAMVKAFSYGSGSYEIAKMLENKVDYFAVAYADEGVILRQNGLNTPIMIMNVDEDSFGKCLEFDLEPVVFGLGQLEEIIRYTGSRTVNIHIEFDTGMHRLGFSVSEFDALTGLLLSNRKLHVKSVFSHLSASDESVYDPFTEQQFNSFRSLSKTLEDSLGYKISKHISNTAASLRFNQDGFDMVRLGIGLYGIDPSGENQKMLENVFTLRTTISQIKMVPANESVGYARLGIENHERRIAVLAIGYADGLNRLLSNGKGGFMIHGLNAPIIGNVCMDMCMVDVTNINCLEGDEAVLFGRNKSIVDLATQLGTIPYEILTGISQRVKRIFVSE